MTRRDAHNGRIPGITPRERAALNAENTRGGAAAVVTGRATLAETVGASRGRRRTLGQRHRSGDHTPAYLRRLGR